MELGENVQGAVKVGGGSEEALFDFSVMLLEHLGSGEVRPMEYYQARFPGYEDEVATEYSAICHVSATELKGSVDMMAPEARYLGDLRIGNYLVERELGRGGQATVYSAKDLRMDRSVALKVLSSTFGRVAPDRMERFRREAAAVAKIDHPCICDVFEADFDSDPPYIAMRLIKGDSIRQHIQRAMLIKIGELDAVRDPKLPCFPTDEEELHTLLRIFERLARALHAAHEDSVFHRDIKPANLILEESGTPMILDFGLARIGGEDSSTLTVTGEVFGTPAYMPPELLRGMVLEPGPSLDVYALAVTLFECLTLKRPFDGGTPEMVYKQILEDEAPSVLEFHPDLSKEVAVVIATALEKDLNRRYTSALDFAEELRRICEHEPIVAAPAGPGLRLRRWLQRHPALGTSIAGSILILAVGLTIALVLLEQVASERNRRVEVVELYDSLVGDVEAVFYREEARKKLKEDPVHALLLANEAYRVEPIELNHREVRRAMDLMHEVKRLHVPFHRDLNGTGYTQDPAPHPTEPWVFYNDLHNNLWFHDFESNETRKVIEGFGDVDGMRVSYDEDGSNLFVSRNLGSGKSPWFDVIEVRAPDGEEVRHRLAVEGEKLRLLDKSSEWAVTTCSDGRIRIWNLGTGDPTHEFSEGGYSTEWAAISPIGGLFALGLIAKEGGLPRVEIWNLSAERQVVQLPDHTQITRGGAWSPSGERLFTFSREGGSLWSYPNAELVTALEHDSRVRGGLYSADGSFLVTRTDNGELRVWDGLTGEELHQLVGHDERLIIDASFSRGSGDLLVTTSFDQTAMVWDVRSGERVRVFRGVLARPTGSWWVGDSDRLMSIEEKGILHTWSLDDPSWPRVISASVGEVRGAWFAQGEERVILSTSAGAVEVIDWRKGESSGSHEWSIEGALAVHVDDARSIVVARTSAEPRVLEWSWETGEERALSGEGPAILEIIPFGEGDSRYLLSTEVGVVEAWDFDSNDRLFTIDPSKLPSWKRYLSEGHLLQVLVSRSRRFLATGAHDGYVRIWNASSGELMRELGPFHPGNSDLRITSMAFSLDEETLFAGCGDAHLRQWSIGTGEFLNEMTTHTANQVVQIDKDHLLISGQYSGKIVMTDLRREWYILKDGTQRHDGRAQTTLGISSGSPVIISGDGSKLLFSDSKLPLRLLETRHMLPAAHTGKNRAVRGSFTMDPQLEEQIDHLSSGIFSPDDGLVLAVGRGRVWIWPTDIVPAAEDVSPVGIDFFGGFPSLGLSEGSVR